MSLPEGLASATGGSEKAVMHYASLEVLRALARGEKYRLCDAAGMMDDSEGEAAFAFLGSSDRRNAREMMEKQPGGKTLIGSFVTDSNPVAGDEMMWQTYGRQSCGCALVFDRAKFARPQEGRHLNAPLEMEMGKCYIPRRECHLCRVTYLKDEHRGTLKGIVAKIHAKFERYPKVSRLLLDFMRFFFKAERYERESEARMVVWRKGGIAHDTSGGFPRAYAECYDGFKPGKVLLGRAVEKPELWKEWLGQQPGTKDIDVDIVK